METLMSQIPAIEKTLLSNIALYAGLPALMVVLVVPMSIIDMLVVSLTWASVTGWPLPSVMVRMTMLGCATLPGCTCKVTERSPTCCVCVCDVLVVGTVWLLLVTSGKTIGGA